MLHQHADVAGLRLSGNDEGHRANDAPHAQTQTNALDFASLDDSGKAFATARARAALAGCSLYELADGGYLVSRLHLCRAVPDLGAVNVLLRQVGGVR